MEAKRAPVQLKPFAHIQKRVDVSLLYHFSYFSAGQTFTRTSSFIFSAGTFVVFSRVFLPTHVHPLITSAFHLQPLMRSFTYPYRLLSVLVTLIGAQAAVTFVSNLVVLESLPAVPQGWRQGVSVPAQELLRFRIALKQENAFAFEQHVIDISTPDHPKYGQHMKRDELKAMLRPSSNASTAVLQWLSKEHVQTTDVEDDGDWINFSVAAANAERMLNTKFYYYTGSMGKTMIIRTLRYSVPEKLHQYVQMIQPTTRFGEIRSQHSTLFKQFDIGPARNAQASYSHNAGFNATFCNSTITPDCLKYLYNFAGYESKQNKGISFPRGCCNLDRDGCSQADTIQPISSESVVS